MTKRKTFNVTDFKQDVNYWLKQDHLTPEFKRGVCSALEYVLHKTGNYNGFCYDYIDEIRPCIDDETGAKAVNPRWDSYRELRRTYF